MFADLLIQKGVSTGLERNTLRRENSAGFLEARVSSYTMQTCAEPWDIQGRVYAVEPVCLVRMASRKGFEPLTYGLGKMRAGEIGS